jgi:hypothetical protein
MWQYARYRCIRCSSNLDLSSAIVVRSARESDKTRDSPGEIAKPPMLSRLLDRATSWMANLDLSLSKSSLDFVVMDARETAHASAKNTVYGVINRDTHGLLLCFRTSKKKMLSPAIGAPFSLASGAGSNLPSGASTCLRCPTPRRRRRLQALLRTRKTTAGTS